MMLSLVRSGEPRVRPLTFTRRLMIICERCGWLIPGDCTCGWHADELSRVRIRGMVEQRHRESVARAHAPRWGVVRVDRERRAAG